MADGGIVLCLAGACFLLALAPASRDLAPGSRSLAEAAAAPELGAPEAGVSGADRVAAEVPVTPPTQAGGRVAAAPPPTWAPDRSLAGGEEPDREGGKAEGIVFERSWDSGEDEGTPAVISWWDVDRWEAVEEEQAEWRSAWLREARRNPDAVPLELWPQIVDWAPYDRRLERSARSALSSRSALRRYATSARRGNDSAVRLDRMSAEQIRRWARGALQDLRDRSESRSESRSRRSRRSGRSN